MFLSRRRLVLIGVIAAIAIVIIMLPLILTITLPDVNKLSISLLKVEAVPPDITNASQKPQLNVYFSVYNPIQQALTTSRIDYQLFADGKSLGNGSLSYEDIPLNGRPQLYYNSSSTLKSSFQLTSSADSPILKRMLSNPQAAKQIKWTVEGIAQIESGFSTEPKKFSSQL